jgi:hypothetical protein
MDRTVPAGAAISLASISKVVGKIGRSLWVIQLEC